MNVVKLHSYIFSFSFKGGGGMGRGGGRGRRPRDEFDENNPPHMRGVYIKLQQNVQFYVKIS
jgi:hypothetical protein